MLATVATIIAIPWALFVASCIVHRGKRYEMDWRSGPNTLASKGSFLVLFALYRRIAFVIFGTSLILMLLSRTLREMDAVMLFMASAVYGLGFNLWTALCFELYIHGKYPLLRAPFEIEHEAGCTGPSNYTGTRYSATVTLGISAFLFFVLGLITLVVGDPQWQL